MPVIDSATKKRLNLPPEGDYGLGFWLDRQNKFYLKGELSQERCDRLIQCGYAFKPEEEHAHVRRWNQQYDNLVECKKNHGNKNMPSTEKSLGECHWLITYNMILRSFSSFTII